MSSIRVTPWALMSALPTVVIGATEVRFGDGIRVPVTTISATSPPVSAAAAAAAPALARTASPLSRVVVIR